MDITILPNAKLLLLSLLFLLFHVRQDRLIPLAQLPSSKLSCDEDEPILDQRGIDALLNLLVGVSIERDIENLLLLIFEVDVSDHLLYTDETVLKFVDGIGEVVFVLRKLDKREDGVDALWAELGDGEVFGEAEEGGDWEGFDVAIVNVHDLGLLAGLVDGGDFGAVELIVFREAGGNDIVTLRHILKSRRGAVVAEVLAEGGLELVELAGVFGALDLNLETAVLCYVKDFNVTVVVSAGLRDGGGFCRCFLYDFGLLDVVLPHVLAGSFGALLSTEKLISVGALLGRVCVYRGETFFEDEFGEVLSTNKEGANEATNLIGRLKLDLNITLHQPSSGELSCLRAPWLTIRLLRSWASSSWNRETSKKESDTDVLLWNDELESSTGDNVINNSWNTLETLEERELGLGLDNGIDIDQLGELFLLVGMDSLLCGLGPTSVLVGDTVISGIILFLSLQQIVVVWRSILIITSVAND